MELVAQLDVSHSRFIYRPTPEPDRRLQSRAATAVILYRQFASHAKLQARLWTGNINSNTRDINTQKQSDKLKQREGREYHDQQEDELHELIVLLNRRVSLIHRRNEDELQLVGLVHSNIELHHSCQRRELSRFTGQSDTPGADLYGAGHLAN
jgi:hypothetical protein